MSNVVWHRSVRSGGRRWLLVAGLLFGCAIVTKSVFGLIILPSLAAVWTDPDFDPSVRAFYYARVIEIPTPRWTNYDAVRLGVKMSPDVPMTQQERAWTSPIWYTP